MLIETLSSPNFDSRDGQNVDMLVLHYTGMPTGEEALTRLCDPDSKVSAHYVVEEDGRIFALVAEECRAWHAGVSFWRGNANINQRSIGVEIVNPGHEFGYRPYPQAQMQAVASLCKGILSRHPIPARNVVGHSDIAPQRKEDPGELFDWAFLAEQGVGLWVQGDRCQVQEASAALLAEYGYDTTHLEKSITAFQRHFRPRLLTGEWDAECGKILAGLLEMK